MDLKEINVIIEEFRIGNYSRFSVFYKETKRQIFFTVLPIVRSKEDAEDIAQETYMKFIQSLASFRSGSNPFTFLSTIARNLAINEYNRRKREVEGEDLLQKVPSDYEDRSVSAVLDMIRPLKLLEQEILLLHIVDEYKFREIAEILNKPLSTVLVTYNRALAKLRKGGTDEK